MSSRKHTPIVSEKQRGFFGAELARKRSGKKTKTEMSEEDLVEHLHESAGKDLPSSKMEKQGGKCECENSTCSKCKGNGCNDAATETLDTTYGPFKMCSQCATNFRNTGKQFLKKRSTVNRINSFIKSGSPKLVTNYRVRATHGKTGHVMHTPTTHTSIESAQEEAAHFGAANPWHNVEVVPSYDVVKSINDFINKVDEDLEHRHLRKSVKIEKAMSREDKDARYGPVIATFPSKSHPSNPPYEVRQFKGSNPTCNCKGFTFNRSCNHTRRFAKSLRKEKIEKKRGYTTPTEGTNVERLVEVREKAKEAGINLGELDKPSTWNEFLGGRAVTRPGSPTPKGHYHVGPRGGTSQRTHSPWKKIIYGHRGRGGTHYAKSSEDIAKNINSFIYKYDFNIDRQKKAKTISEHYIRQFNRAPSAKELEKGIEKIDAGQPLPINPNKIRKSE